MEVKQSNVAKSILLGQEETPAVTPQVEAVVAPAPTAPVAAPQPQDEDTVTVPVVEATPAPDAPAPTVTQDEVIEFAFPEEAAPAIETAIPQTTTQVQSWKDLVKDVNEDELADFLGDDDFIKGMRKHIKNGGAPYDYIAAKGVNWESVSDTDILKNDLRRQFPDATTTQIDRLFNKKYSQTDLAEEEDKEDGLLMIKSDARKLRADKISEQQKFKIADAKQIQQPQVQQPQVDPAKQARLQQDGNYIVSHQATKNLFENKRVAIELGEGVKPLNIGVQNPQALMDVFFKPGILEKFTRTQQGEPDVQAIQEASLFLANRALFKKSIFNAGRTAERNAIVEEGQNAGKQATVVSMEQQHTNYGSAFNTNIKEGTAAKFIQR